MSHITDSPRSRAFGIGAKLSVVGIFILTACSATRSTSSSPVSPSRASKDSTRAETKVLEWSPQIIRQRLHYSIEDSSTVSLSNDSAARTMLIDGRSFYTVVISDSDSRIYLTIRVDSQALNNRSTITGDSNSAPMLRAVLNEDGKILRTITEDKQSCSTTRTLPQARLNDLQISLPPIHSMVGTRWTDSTFLMICHGKTPLLQKAVHEYQLLAFTTCNQRNAVSIQRISTNSITTVSADTTNHLTATGSGTSRDMICLNRDNGVLIESTGESRLDLTVRTSRGIFPFVQNTISHIHAL